jgi:membrane protein DedA with SNARE-associated domain
MGDTRAPYRRSSAALVRSRVEDRDRLQIGVVQHLLTESGYAALVLFAFAEACCVPIPSEVTFGFAGVLAASGRLNLAIVLLVGVAAELAGSSTAYAIGRVGGRPLVDRLGRYVLLTTRDLDRAERWLSGRGEFAVAVGRALPVIRAFTSIVAGTADMSTARFEVFNFIGTLVYTGSFAAVGFGVGYEWKRVAHDFSIVGYVLVALVVVAVAAFVVLRLRELRRERRLAEADVSEDAASR